MLLTIRTVIDEKQEDYIVSQLMNLLGTNLDVEKSLLRGWEDIYGGYAGME